MTKIGLKIQYNKEITAIVLDENETHVLIETNKGSKFCVLKSSIEWNKYINNGHTTCSLKKFCL